MWTLRHNENIVHLPCSLPRTYKSVLSICVKRVVRMERMSRGGRHDFRVARLVFFFFSSRWNYERKLVLCEYYDCGDDGDGDGRCPKRAHLGGVGGGGGGGGRVKSDDDKDLSLGKKQKKKTTNHRGRLVGIE